MVVQNLIVVALQLKKKKKSSIRSVYIFDGLSYRPRRVVYDICRLQTADRRLQVADCKLKDTKNLSNKGDTIKNITSCESEKVAWEQG